MELPDIINTSGVALILTAFFLDTFNFINNRTLVYFSLNIAGSGLACYGSFLIKAYPFVILEGAWAFISLIGIWKIIFSPSKIIEDDYDSTYSKT